VEKSERLPGKKFLEFQTVQKVKGFQHENRI
jgi:hypothetical protein